MIIQTLLIACWRNSCKWILNYSNISSKEMIGRCRLHSVEAAARLITNDDKTHWLLWWPDRTLLTLLANSCYSTDSPRRRSAPFLEDRKWLQGLFSVPDERFPMQKSSGTRTEQTWEVMDEEPTVQRGSKVPLGKCVKRTRKAWGRKSARTRTQAGEVNSREGNEGCRISDDYMSNFVISCHFFRQPPPREEEATRGTVSEIHVGVFGVEWAMCETWNSSLPRLLQTNKMKILSR
jgi:hypothetical protein